MQTFGATYQLFLSNPLHAMGDYHYFSCFPQDGIFGATYDALRHRWHGVSLANSPARQRHMNRTIAIGIASVRQARGPAALVASHLRRRRK